MNRQTMDYDMKVLAVDDSRDALETLGTLLDHLGHESEGVKNADDALDAIDEGGFDVVISDIMMPSKSGLELLQDLLPRPSAPPVVLLTGYSNADNAISALRLGAVDFLRKPVGLEDLHACLLRVQKQTVLHNQLLAEREKRARSEALLDTRRETETLLKNRNQELEELNAQLQENNNQLVQSEKMAAIGQLAAGVAHEINNPVGFVKSNLGTLKEYVDAFKQLIAYYSEFLVSTDEARKAELRREIKTLREDEDIEFIAEDVDNLLTESIEGAERIQEIVQNLKSFARADAKEAKDYDVNEGLEATLNIVWNELKYKCDVHREFNAVPRIKCFGGQLNQVFMNLLVNASHAIPEKGEITVRTEEVDGTIVVTISDTGVGISPENMDRIFNPFFTTKEVGKGTGLGLAISHGIIEKHQGKLEVDSIVGEGTTFRVIIPANLDLSDEEDGEE